MTKKKSILVIIIALSCTLLLAAVVLLCFINIKGDKPDQIIIKEENGAVVIDANNASSGNGYIFKFKNEKEEVKIDSIYGVVETSTLSQVLEFGQIYQVSVCVRGEVDGGNSLYSDPVEWVASKRLDTPSISVKNEKLIITEIDGADYYEIFYNPNGKAKSLQTEDIEIALSKLDGGVFDIFVKAYSKESYLLQSSSSNTIAGLTNIHELKEPLFVQLNKNTKVISIYLEDYVDQIELYAGETKENATRYILSNVDCVEAGDLYCIRSDISFVYNSQKIYGIKLVGDAYNRYTKNIIWAE